MIRLIRRLLVITFSAVHRQKISGAGRDQDFTVSSGGLRSVGRVHKLLMRFRHSHSFLAQPRATAKLLQIRVGHRHLGIGRYKPLTCCVGVIRVAL